MTDPQPKVDNPRKADLVKLRNDLAKDVDHLRKALSRPTEDMGGDKVWVGKNARAWQPELAGRNKKLGEQVDKLLPLIDAAIRSEPDKVSPNEARMYHQGM
ncbi:hypothetical protein ABT072_25860 [Streptomyces sp. NPDC002589]|uniref:hypothetical protein n=1 Tax=Streptomyces sp. NPDC002589 TaxID=3154420 RepID=UPI00331AF83F